MQTRSGGWGVTSIFFLNVQLYYNLIILIRKINVQVN